MVEGMTSEFVNIYKAFPEGYRALSELERVLAASPLDHATFELVKMRASQLNGCAYCIDMHHKDARAAEAKKKEGEAKAKSGTDESAVTIS